MCVACGQELCKQCKGCHNSECERYTEPTEEYEIDEKNLWSFLSWPCSCIVQTSSVSIFLCENI